MATTPKYRILNELRKGGMGRIFRGVLVGDAGFERPVVLKQLREDGDPERVRLFVEEARRYAVLDHENLGRILDFDVVDGRRCIVLEYIDGWTVADYLERHRAVGRRPGPELTVFIMSRVCRALQYVFERARIVHRDVSPGNVMMTREGAVKLIDFGIATRSGARDDTLTGKPAYMAPEMVLDLPADHRTDVFCLGVVFWEMLTNDRLFPGPDTARILEQVVAGRIPSPREKAPEVPETVAAIVRQALQREPERRFASAGDMGAACEHHLYDKGYGPTNLTLKEYLARLFPDAGPDDVPTPEPAPAFDPSAIPRAARAGDTTVVSRPARGRRLPS